LLYPKLYYDLPDVIEILLFNYIILLYNKKFWVYNQGAC